MILNHKKAREAIKHILKADIRFEGHFDRCFNNLKRPQQNNLFEWVKRCREREENPVSSKRNRNMIGFVKRFGSNLRAILTKEKDRYFIALFLDKHKYYETEMERLGF